MKERKYSHLVPSIADIVFLSIFLHLCLINGAALLGDGDTGYHVRTGEYILRTRAIPTKDIFSFISPPISWTAHEWLSEIVMALLHKAAGLTAVVVFFAFLIALVYYLLFKIVRTETSDVLVGIGVVVLAAGASQIHWLARPHVFSLLLTLIWYRLLDLYQYRDKNYLWYLPPLMLLWVNLHGGYIVGLALIGVYATGNIVAYARAAGEDRGLAGARVKTMALVGAACLLAALVNPIGYHILLFPFKVTSNRFLMDNIIEFMPPNFHDPLPFKYLLLVVLAVFAVSVRRLNFIEVVLVLVFTNMALYSARYIPLFAIIVSPVLARQGDGLVSRWNGRLSDFWRKRAERIGSVDLRTGGYLWPAAAVLCVALFTASGTIRYTFDRETKPVQAVEFLQREHLEGNMFNNDEFGDYMIYAAWPMYRVFFDGRSDMYGVARLKEYFKVAQIEPGWADVLAKYDINWIFYGSGSTLAEFLLQRSDWRLIYADKVANIFVRNTPRNRRLLEKYADVRPVETDLTDKRE